MRRAAVAAAGSGDSGLIVLEGKFQMLKHLLKSEGMSPSSSGTNIDIFPLIFVLAYIQYFSF